MIGEGLCRRVIQGFSAAPCAEHSMQHGNQSVEGTSKKQIIATYLNDGDLLSCNLIYFHHGVEVLASLRVDARKEKPERKLNRGGSDLVWMTLECGRYEYE